MQAIHTLIVAGVAITLVAACSTTQQEGWAVDGIADGSRLVVEEPIRISSYSGHAHVQQGREVDPRAINRFEPHCRIRLRGAGSDVEAIEPDTFEVGGYRTRREVTSLEPDGQLRVASSLRGGSFVSYVRHHTRVTLYSPDQPAVHEMVCSYDRSRRAPHLQFDQIRDTLAGIATLERP